MSRLIDELAPRYVRDWQPLPLPGSADLWKTWARLTPVPRRPLTPEEQDLRARIAPLVDAGLKGRKRR